MGQSVELDNVTMRFGDFVAVRNVSLKIGAGEFFSFLGPSGCGKTTILRLISGFMEPTEGAVRIGSKDMRGIGPNRRPTALIFQNLALFPLMKVWENIAFGLEARGVGKAQRRRRAEELLDLIALPGYADKAVSELSGGQRQRVAIARALAVEPAVLLLDEPLSALDLKLRQHMRSELRAIQRKTGVTFIYITHDQGEALTMSDRIGVMSQGEVLQIGQPADIYDAPQNAFVATFVGESNLFPGTISRIEGKEALIETAVGPMRGRNLHALPVGTPAIALVRPERMRVLDAGEAADNTLESAPQRFDFEGAFINVLLDGAGERETILHLTNDGRTQARLQAATLLRVGFDTDATMILPQGQTAHG